MHGANAPDLVIEVPVGTQVSDLETGEIICDLDTPGETFVLCE